ncbi:MAG: DUF47 family protein [Desulfurococcaceae archaeon]
MKWLFLSGEKLKECIDKFLIHYDYVVKTVYKLGEISRTIVAHDVKSAESIYNEIWVAERNADNVKREVIGLISVPFIDAKDREDILMLMDKVEEIASHAKSASKLIVMINKLDIRVESRVAEIIVKMVDKTINAMDELVQVVKNIGEPIDRITNSIVKIKNTEEEIDELRFDALSHLFSRCSEKLDVSCIVTKDLIDEVEKISDVCEDVCDLVKLISLSK